MKDFYLLLEGFATFQRGRFYKFGRTRSQATFYTHDLAFEKNSRFWVEEREEEDKGKRKIRKGNIFLFLLYFEELNISPLKEDG